MLPRRIPKAPKRASRWRSQAHCNHVRGFACAMCGSTAGIEVAHVRIGSGAGIGQKPDDWNTVPLCGGAEGCHTQQHRMGEQTFWLHYRVIHGQTVDQLMSELIKASPRKHEIEQVQRERGVSLTSPRVVG
jgi:hypothetical protein